jgi:archaemetzincin
MRWLAVALVVAMASEARAEPFVVCVQPFGRPEPWAVPVVRRGIEHVYGAVTRVLPTRPLPEAAWYSPRKRWRADRLLDALLAQDGVDGCGAIVGVTRDDISTTRDDAHPDWGILGLAYLGDRVAVVSTFRARRRVSRRVAAERLVKVANHELGHVLGLPHGGAPGCIMNDAGGSVRTVDRERGTLCDDERAQVEQRIGAVPVRAAIDWRAVIGEL